MTITMGLHLFDDICVALIKIVLHLSSVLIFKKEKQPYISTLSTLIPQSAVASSSMDCMAPAMLSLSLRISCRFFVPRMFLREVWASNLGEYGHCTGV